MRNNSIDTSTPPKFAISIKKVEISPHELVSEIIENDDLSSFKLQLLTHEMLMNLRFEYDMNLLQLVCHEEAVSIL
jgi:hypothetical protein